ncbi:MAG: hypothetical protein K2P57_00745 [Burkholderiales bacterium]|nr:hypothetical protein [Burkholderiales bacterium]
MAEESLYAVLGTREGALQEDILRAFRAHAFDWGALQNGKEEERMRFRQWAHAYAVLSDHALRAKYDAEGEDASFREKLNLALDLALKGYDDEMLAEYLRRLSFSEETISELMASVSKVRATLAAPEISRIQQTEKGFRQVRAGQGWQWVVEGFMLFRKAPLIWIVLCMILTGIGLTLSLIPVAGEIVLYLASPIFAAGLMQGCRDLEQGGELELAHLFVGFRKDIQQLFLVGGVYLFGQMLILGLMIAFGGDTMSKFFFGTSDVDPSTLPAAEMSRVMLALLVGMAASIPLMMMIWFAPMLVIFRGVQAKVAMRLSFSACFSNMLPFLVFGSVFLALAFLSGITFGLGLLLMIPLMFTSSYASYRDIFENRPHIDIEVG